MNQKKIIDISTYNNVTNWSLVAKEVDMAIIKATQGHSLYNAGLKFFTDSKFNNHITNAIRYNIPVACYHFFTANSIENAIKEADQFEKVIRPYKNNILYAICDAENYGNKYLLSLNRNELSNVIIAFCERLEQHGYKTIVYTNTDHINNYIDINLINRPLWVADYTKSKPPIYDSDIWAWQYTDKGKVNGIKGNVDLSYGYFELNDANEDSINNSVKDDIDINKLHVGDIVKVINITSSNNKVYSTTYTGTKWRVYYNEYMIHQLINDKAIIKYNNTIVASVNINNLKKIR